MATQPSLLEQIEEIASADESRRARADRLARLIRDDGGFLMVGIYDVDLSKGHVVNLAWAGAEAPAHPRFSIRNGLTGRAISQRKTVNVGHVAEDPDYLAALGRTESEIIVPILDGRDVVGTIDVESVERDAFPPPIQALMEACARAARLIWA